MVVYPERMLENLNRSRGVVFSGQVLLELARRGVSREQAYEWVQRNAMRAFHEQQDFKALLLADPDVARVLPAAEIEKNLRFERAAAERGCDLRTGLRREPVTMRAIDETIIEHIRILVEGTDVVPAPVVAAATAWATVIERTMARRGDARR